MINAQVLIILREGMKEKRLRHHHLLCTQTFTGKGYDYRFVANMEDVVEALGSPKDLVIRLSIGSDDICSLCPNEVRGLCRDESSVIEKDRSAAMFLDIPEEAVIPAEQLIKKVRERLQGLDDFRLICGECEWLDLYNEQLAFIKNK